jgi:hypothetical protein
MNIRFRIEVCRDLARAWLSKNAKIPKIFIRRGIDCEVILIIDIFRLNLVKIPATLLF